MSDVYHPTPQQIERNAQEDLKKKSKKEGGEQGKGVKRERETAVAPIDVFEPEDVAEGAQAFDKWLRSISGDYVTLDRLMLVAGSLPVVGNIFAVVDVIQDVIVIVEKYRKPEDIDFLDWLSLGINVIGVIPAPGTAAARTSFRPALHLLKKELSPKNAKRAVQNISETIMQVLIANLNDKIAGEIEEFVSKSITKIDPLLDDCVTFTDKLADDLIGILEKCINKGQTGSIFNNAKQTPEKALHDPKKRSSWSKMLAALDELQELVADGALAAAAAMLPKVMVAVIELVIEKIKMAKVQFRAKLKEMAMEKTEMGIKWLVVRLEQALLKRKAALQNKTLADKGNESEKNKGGNGLGALGTNADPKGSANKCKQCPATGDSRKSIDFALGCESFTHDDFALEAPLPIAWRRTYRSNLEAYDQGSLGARWITPYSLRVDVVGEGLKRGLVYRSDDGRSLPFPWLNVGQRYRDSIEEITLTRMTETLLVLDFGKPMPDGQPSAWRESYELVETVPSKVEKQGRQHFRLVALHGENGAAIGLRYDHIVTMGPNAGEQVLSDVVSKQGTQTIAHVGTQIHAHTGQIQALWEIKEGKLLRQVAAYEHDAAGDLIRAQDEDGAAREYRYEHHLVTRYTDRTGRGMNLAYDGTGPKAKAIREWADDGSFDTKVEWDENIRLTYVTDALGQETRYYYDILGYTYRVIYPDGNQEWFYRDKAKNVTRHVHTDGSIDDYLFDKDGNLQRHTRPDGTKVHFEYDKLNRLTGVRDAEGGVWRRDYDVQGNLVETSDPRGFKTEFAYDQAGRVTEITDAKGGVKKMTYSKTGQLESYTDCSGQTSRWVFDERDRLVQTIDAKGNATKYRYATLNEESLQGAALGEGSHPGQLETIVHADGTEEHLRLDAEGRLLQHRDALDRVTRFSYTAAGLIKQRTNAMGQELGYSWDKLGRLTMLHNENNKKYSFVYDPVGKPLNVCGFDDKRTEYIYEETTGVLQEVVERGPWTEGEDKVHLKTRLEFDLMGRLIARKGLVPGRDEEVEVFGYNSNGQLSFAQNANTKLQWFFDSAGNMVREHHDNLASKQTAVWRHGYDELNQRINTLRPDGHTLGWLTYGSGHVHGLLVDGEDVLGFERDELHREMSRTQVNGLVQRQTYDLVGRLIEQSVMPVAIKPNDMRAIRQAMNGHGSTTILRKYDYDKAGQLTNVADSRRGSIRYNFDPVGRLLKAQSRLGTELFAFDPAGNIAVPKDGTETYRGVTGNKVMDNLLREFAGISYRYDDRGNLIERLQQGQRSTFEWDAFNRMIQASTPSGITTFIYDPLGRRVSKHHHGKSEDRRTLFGWDGDMLAYESTFVEGRGLTPVTDTVHYVNQPGSFVPVLQARRNEFIKLRPTTDVKALMENNEGKYDVALDPLWNGELDLEDTRPFTSDEIAFYQCDHLGTPQELTDSKGDLAWAAQYKAWGVAKEVIGDAARKAGFKNPIRFQGQYFDDETGLHYNRHRYFDPDSGRYLSKDPIGLKGGLNLQAYVANPTGWIDPLGLDHLSVFWGAVGTTGNERDDKHYQVHHIIPQEMFDKKYTALLKCAGIEKDGMSNLIGLPTHREASGFRRGNNFGTSLHNNNHTAYSDEIADKLKEIQRLKHTGVINCKQAAARIRRMQVKLRAALKSNAPLMSAEGSSEAYWNSVLKGR